MTISLRAMSIDDYSAVFALWQRAEGIGLSASDARERIATFLQRNSDMSAVAADALGNVVGAVLCGHDGRRGYLHHLAVDAPHRHRGVAARLITWCVDRLTAERIDKCNVFLFDTNVQGALFWQHNGWSLRSDLRVFQRKLG
jgi:putative acetyltransferase